MRGDLDPRMKVMTLTHFPTGYQHLHQDVSMNFQMNRWFSWVGEEGMLEEMRSIASRIANYSDWKREFLAVAESASRQGHVLRSGYYFRAAEFFMRPDDPDRKIARQKFLHAVESAHAPAEVERHDIPYADGRAQGFLPAYVYRRVQSRGIIVFFGGFDSYIEELTPAFLYLRAAGYEVIAFEGPGQGGALNDAGLHMIVDWHKPVKAVLDFFKLENVTLIGLSMGGCLVIRAAAFEPRVERVVAYNIYPDSLDVNLRQVKLPVRVLLKTLLNLRAASVVNMLAKRVAKRNPIAQWGVEEGMHVTGTSSPYEYFQQIRQFHTIDVSQLVKQHVLLLAGSEDHLVPMSHLYRQIKLLKNARSITTRVFTKSESASNHCQVGNYGLALKTIVHWLDGT
jgi:pimeloyl-ACP methyl ester carboxylesterase